MSVSRTRTAFVALALTGALAACGTWVHPNKSAADYEKDRLACDQWALGQVPVAMVTRQVAPAREEPPKTTCVTRDNHTTCTTVPGARIGPQYSTDDVNANNRSNSSDQCLKAGGWVYKTNNN